MFSITLIIMCLFKTFYFSHPSVYEVLSPCGFDCIFLMADDVEYLFMRSFVHFLIELLVFLLLSCKSSLYILGAKSLIKYMICKHFLPFCRLSFYLLGDIF